MCAVRFRQGDRSRGFKVCRTVQRHFADSGKKPANDNGQAAGPALRLAVTLSAVAIVGAATFAAVVLNSW